MKNLLRKNKKGFTLVELIVVIVILAILAAILVPTLSTYVDKAKERVLITEARSAYMALQVLASEAYGLGTNFTVGTDYTAEFATDAEKLAQVSGTISGVKIDTSAKISAFVYTDGTNTVTFDGVKYIFEKGTTP